MEKDIPNYLRLHVEPSLDSPPPPLREVPGLEDICRTFPAATGWQLSVSAGLVDDRTANWSAPIPGGPVPSPGLLTLQRGATAAPEADPLEALESVRPLAGALAGLIGQVWQLRFALWQREAELAAGVPVVPHPREVGHLAERLEAVLRGGAEAIGCQAAGLYLLDDATSNLKLRACWGLPQDRLLAPARTLRGALADLEALVGHAVALEDTHLLPHWRVPEDFPAALCVPVSTPTMPLGTLWFFADRTRPFMDEQTHLAEIIAGRLAADLEREMLLRQGIETRQLEKAVQQAQRWQQLRLPTIAPLLDHWQVAGWTAPTERLSSGFHDWCVPPDGSLALAAADVHSANVDAALTAATVQTALRAHTAYPHTARQLVQRVNETLWSASPGDWPVSLFYGLVQPDTGELSYCGTGRLAIYKLAAGQCRQLLTGAALVGLELEQEFDSQCTTLEPGELLLVVTPGVDQAEPPAGIGEQLLPLLEQQPAIGAKELLDDLQGALAAAHFSGSVLVVKRLAN